MCRAMQELMADARAEGRSDIVLEMLKELGTLPETLIQRITSERDMDVLRSWAKLAARAGSVQEFELGM